MDWENIRRTQSQDAVQNDDHLRLVGLSGLKR